MVPDPHPLNRTAKRLSGLWRDCRDLCELGLVLAFNLAWVSFLLLAVLLLILCWIVAAGG